MKNVAVIGLGLMGGSLCSALKNKVPAVHVKAWARRDETRRTALAAGIVDQIFDDPAETVNGCDIAVFCLPVLSIPDLMEKCRSGFSEKCAVTDVGSTKDHLAKQAAVILRDVGASFVGSHPIAGSEETGIDSARANLYENAVVVMTPSKGSKKPAIDMVQKMWTAIGAKVIFMKPKEHDELIASTSHLPHIAASALVKTIFRAPSENTSKLCGTGFRDSTRIAAGSPDMWKDIVITNSKAISKELSEFSRHISAMRKMLAKKDYDALTKYLEESSRIRKEFKKD